MGVSVVRFHRKLSEKYKFIFSLIINLQILLVFGVIMVTLVLLESRVLGYNSTLQGDGLYTLLKFIYVGVFSLELILTVAYQVCSYFWKQEVFGVYIGEYYKLTEEDSYKDEK